MVLFTANVPEYISEIFELTTHRLASFSLFIALYVMGKSPETRFNYVCLCPPNSRFMNMDNQSLVVNPVQEIKKRNNKCCFS